MDLQDYTKKLLDASDLKVVVENFIELSKLINWNWKGNWVPSTTEELPTLSPTMLPFELLLDRNVDASKELCLCLQAKKNQVSSNSPIKKRILIIGGGVAGLRSSIEMSLLGGNVCVVEKRSYFSRNNILHLWPFTISDLKSIGLKITYRRFCRGSIDHIGTKRLQIELLKISLLCGAHFFPSCSFQSVEEEETGWKATLQNLLIDLDASPSTPPSSSSPSSSYSANLASPHFESSWKVPLDVLLGAEGERSQVSNMFAFQKRISKAGEAIAITANFINKNSKQETILPEFGFAYFLNQQLFKRLEDECGVKMENLVYYRNETHYLVMTVKRSGLLNLGIIKEDKKTVEELLHSSNIDFEKLRNFAVSVAKFNNLPPEALEYARNQNGVEDAQIFDFTSKHQCEESFKVVAGNTSKQNLYVGLVGDSLVAPFWPQGTGANRAVIGSLDTTWALSQLSSVDDPSSEFIEDVLKKRQDAYKNMLSVTANNMKEVKDFLNTVSPSKRYKVFDDTIMYDKVSDFFERQKELEKKRKSSFL